jgi:Spy/CpxP family protein refolding chaperone
MKHNNLVFATLSLAALCTVSGLAQQSTSSSSSSGSPRPQTLRTAHFRSDANGGDPGPGGPDGPGVGPRFGPHAGPSFGPPGMWWKNPDIIQKLSLSTDQQKKMDDIFQQSRLQLIDLKANVEKQEAILEPMLSANPPDTNKVLSQIDHVASARAELEKASARMLLGIRGVLTADQWTKLQAERPNFRRKFEGREGRGDHDGPGGPGGPRSNGFKGPGGPGAPISMGGAPSPAAPMSTFVQPDASEGYDHDI